KGKENVLVEGGFFDLEQWGFRAGRAAAEKRGYDDKPRTIISHDKITRLHPEARVSFNL
ncbi:unnamed protein product, partial [marine sediment metagenome]